MYKLENKEITFGLWLLRIFLPDFCKFVGLLGLVLVISFIIIVQSDKVITFVEFAVMRITTEINNIAFWFVENGNVGEIIRDLDYFNFFIHFFALFCGKRSEHHQSQLHSFFMKEFSCITKADLYFGKTFPSMDLKIH